jgi:hypothetical protein
MTAAKALRWLQLGVVAVGTVVVSRANIAKTAEACAYCPDDTHCSTAQGGVQGCSIYNNSCHVNGGSCGS